MLKDKLLNALSKTNKFISGESDELPIGMRGELEVIVKDRDGKLISYERGHNQVTNLAKAQIIHLLAGEVGVEKKTLYSKADSLKRAFSTEHTQADAEVYNTFSPVSDDSENKYGYMVSGRQYFDKGVNPMVSQVNLTDANETVTKPLSANYPTKMLFGTGLEFELASGADAEENLATLQSIYNTEMGADSSISAQTIMKLNGFEAEAYNDDRFTGVLKDSNYKANNYYCANLNGENKFARTLQPITTDPLKEAPKATDTTIIGAIKDCNIHSANDDKDKWSEENRTAAGEFKGTGRPAFIYAQRTTAGFYNINDKDNELVHYSIAKDEFDATIGPTMYDTELTYVVNMPAQPVNSESLSSYYPYNGWILKQAGLFCDAPYNKDGKSKQESDSPEKDPNRIFDNSASGMLLFKRNLSSPILKTPDLNVTFVWHIFLAM